MAAGFNASDGGRPVPEQQDLVYVLRHHLWPILSLPTSLHDLLNAWSYLRQFALTGVPFCEASLRPFSTRLEPLGRLPKARLRVL